MTSHTTELFRKLYEGLPPSVQQQAREAYKLFRHEPQHPSLHFKLIHPTRPIYSVRISASYRAIGVREGNEIIWFWIGSHADYDKLIARM